MRAITGIASTSQVEHVPTEEEQLQEFIKNYIDEPAPKFSWRDVLQKQMAYSALYGGLNTYSGRGSAKSFGYHNLVIMDEVSVIKEKPTFKPTKKQAKLLKKFRKLKRFK